MTSQRLFGVRAVIIFVAVVCCQLACALSDNSNFLQAGIDSLRPTSPMEKWNRVHHVIKGLLATRVNPETGKEKLVDETIRETPLGKAEGIFSVLGRQRVSRRHNKLRFNVGAMVSSRMENYPGKATPGYVPPSVIQAELRVFKTPGNLPVNHRKSRRANITVTSPTSRGVVGHKLISLQHNSWEVIDVTEFVKEMIKSPNSAYDFGFHAHSAGNHHRRLSVSNLLQLSGDENNSQRPVLVIYLAEPVEPLQYILSRVQGAKEEAERKKRAAAVPCDEDRQRREVEGEAERPTNVTDSIEVIIDHLDLRPDACRLRSFYVDFASIGWGHIISPIGFDPKICSGHCYDPFVSSTNHAIVRSWAYRNEHPELAGSAIPTVCCTPTRFESMTLVSEEQGGETVKFDTYYDMIAEECGCR